MTNEQRRSWTFESLETTFRLQMVTEVSNDSTASFLRVNQSKNSFFETYDASDNLPINAV